MCTLYFLLHFFFCSVEIFQPFFVSLSDLTLIELRLMVRREKVRWVVHIV